MENLPATPDHHLHEDDDDNEDDEDEDDEDEDDDDDGGYLGQVSLSSSSPLIAFVSNTIVGLSATLASLIVMTIRKHCQRHNGPRVLSL